jgi:hypothetical protein
MNVAPLICTKRVALAEPPSWLQVRLHDTLDGILRNNEKECEIEKVVAQGFLRCFSVSDDTRTFRIIPHKEEWVIIDFSSAKSAGQPHDRQFLAIQNSE